MSKYAYVTFIIRNDSYLPGALLFAYALKMQKTEHDLICMVSENISSQAIQNLRVLYDDVIVMNEVYTPHNNRQERQDRPFLFSRFNAFRLGKDGDLGKEYEKIVIADSDILPIEKYDLLFKLMPPAGIINEKKEYCIEYENGKYIIPKSVYADGTWCWHEIYKDYPHGSILPKQLTDGINTDKENMGINASLMLFEPSMKLYNSIMEDTREPKILSEIANYKWPEMQYITLKLSGKWTNIDLRYSSFNGYPILDVLYGIHYAGLKPWNINNRSLKSYKKFADYQLWIRTYLEMLRKYPYLNNGKLLRIKDFFINLIEKNENEFDISVLNKYKHLL